MEEAIKKENEEIDAILKKAKLEESFTDYLPLYDVISNRPHKLEMEMFLKSYITQRMILEQLVLIKHLLGNKK